MRNEILALIKLGELPDNSSDADEELIFKYEFLLENIPRPVSDSEAKILATLFGMDDCFGLAWTLVHLIESAPSWPISECLQGENPWVKFLIKRSGTITFKGSLPSRSLLTIMAGRFF